MPSLGVRSLWMKVIFKSSTLNLNTTLQSQATPAAFLSMASGGRVRHYSGTTRNWMLPLVVIMFHLLISAAGADDETQGKSSA
jgi:hypothetical protein